jgi:hypothetical protein
MTIQLNPELINNLGAPIIPRFNSPHPSAFIFLQLCDIKIWQFFLKQEIVLKFTLQITKSP